MVKFDREVTSNKGNKIEEKCNTSTRIRFDDNWQMRLLYLQRRSCGSTHRAAGHAHGRVTGQTIEEGLGANTNMSQCRIGEAED